MVFGKLTNFGYFPLDAILSNTSDHAPPCHTYFLVPIHRTHAQCKQCTADINVTNISLSVGCDCIAHEYGGRALKSGRGTVHHGAMNSFPP